MNFAEVKKRFGAEELLELAKGEGYHHRGSGRRRAGCPGCRNDDPRGISIGEKNGVGLWHCFRDPDHRGTAIDFVALARGIDVRAAADELRRHHGEVVLDHHRVRAPDPSYPPIEEVADVWSRARPLFDVPDIAEWWRARGLDVEQIDERGLARALPYAMNLPRWAWGAGHSWSEGRHRLVVPMFDAQRRMVTLHARAARAPEGKPKGLSPTGYSIGGAIMADARALELLAGQLRDVDVLVAEGVPDFLAWGTHWLGGAPAIFSVIAGSWTKAIADFIPNGSRVLIATHADEAGEKYANWIVRTLRGRCRALRTHLEAA